MSRDADTSQGRIISPLLCNIALNGLEKVVEDCLKQKKDTSKKRKNKGELTYCRYADKFIVAHLDLQIIHKVKRRIKEYLVELGLELSEAKMKIAHSKDKFESYEPGINFLGFRIWHTSSGRHNAVNVRGHIKDFKLLIIPEKKKVLEHLKEMKSIIKRSKTVSQETLIRLLAPKVRGWSNFYCYVYSKATFSYCDYRM